MVYHRSPRFWGLARPRCFPGTSHIGFKLFLACLDPWRIVLLSDLHAAVPQEYRHTLDWDTLQKKFDSERIPEPV